MATQGERLAVLEEQVRKMDARLAELEREVMGPGNGTRKSVRRRLHDLENDKTTAKLADATLERFKSERQRQDDRTFGKREKIAALLLVLGAPLLDDAYAKLVGLFS